MMNRALFTSHCYLSWGLVWPYIMALVHVLTALRAPYSEIVKEASESSCGQCSHFMYCSRYVSLLFAYCLIQLFHFLACYFRLETSEVLVHMYSDRTCVNVEFDKGGNSTVQHVVS
jgi:hypothetical protein